jgi:hypothetical protein
MDLDADELAVPAPAVAGRQNLSKRKGIEDAALAPLSG